MQRSSLLVSVLALLLCTANATAQLKPPARRGPPRVKMLDRWTKDLGLTPAQRGKIDAIFKTVSAQTKQVRADKSLSRDQQRERVTKLHQATRARALLVLTAQQRQKLTQLEAQRGDVRRRQALEKMSQPLHLSATQKSKILAAWKTAASQSRAVRENSALSPEQRKARLQVINADTRAHVSQLLTPAQRAKMAQMRAQEQARRQHQQVPAAAPGHKPGQVH